MSERDPKLTPDEEQWLDRMLQAPGPVEPSASLRRAVAEIPLRHPRPVEGLLEAGRAPSLGSWPAAAFRYALLAAFASIFFLPEPWGYIAVAVAAVVEVGEVYLWIRFLRRYRVTTGAEGLVGEWAEVVEPLAPTGRVRLRGELWAARSPRPAIPGQQVRITSVDGLTLEVEPE